MKTSHKQSAVAFLEAAASGQVRDAYKRYVGQAVPEQGANENGMF